ncbi:hypothetical protein ACFL20_09715 [Spirochaetota bacterium]
MIKSLIIAIVVLAGGVAFSSFYIGYPHAGKSYIKKQRKARKSLRHGSGYYYGRRGFRGGK